MYINKLAKVTGATARAIRLYEAMGLLQVARRGSYRWYNAEHQQLVMLIKEAQQLGVSLAELQVLLSSGQQMDWPALQLLLADKQQLLQQQIRQAQAGLARLAHCQQQIASCLAQQQAEHSSQCRTITNSPKASHETSANSNPA